MLRLLTGAVLTTALTSGLVHFTASSALADPVCGQTDPATGECLIWVEVPNDVEKIANEGDDGPKDTGAGSACWWDGTSQGISDPPPGPVPCASEYGYWSNTYHCYIQLLDPQPPAGDPSWQGHEPGDGAVYQCYQPPTDTLVWIWTADPPPNSGTGPAPREVAQLAIDRMQLRAIDIGIAPRATDGSVGLVGMPVWMWAAGPDSNTWGPTSASASAGGITITATARVHEVTWDMGDGTEVICTTAGTPYEPAYGKKESPDCGHVYVASSSAEPGGKYTVTATSDWVIEWEGAGQTGTIRLNGLVREAQIAIGEAQVLVQ